MTYDQTSQPLRGPLVEYPYTGQSNARIRIRAMPETKGALCQLKGKIPKITNAIFQTLHLNMNPDGLADLKNPVDLKNNSKTFKLQAGSPYITEDAAYYYWDLSGQSQIDKLHAFYNPQPASPNRLWAVAEFTSGGTTVWQPSQSELTLFNVDYKGLQC
ncbi:MAG: hypothetical protein ACK50P_04330 [Planctomycetaceae bacterium]|jgi:hypothetical protein